MKKRIPVIAAIVLIFVVLAISLGIKVLERFSYSKEVMDPAEYFGVAEQTEVAVILNHEKLDIKGRLSEGRCYLDLDSVHTYFNSRFYADTNEFLLLYALPDRLDSVSFGDPGEEGYAPAFMDGDTVYVALDYIKKYTNFSFTLYSDPNRVVVETTWAGHDEAEIKKDTSVRYQGGVKSDILVPVTEGSSIIILEQMDKWSRVMTKDGYIGYVENKRLQNIHSVTPIPVTDAAAPEYTSIRRDHKINLVWHQVTNMEANSTFASMTADMKGVNVISPTWFFLSDNEGGMTNLVSREYVDAAHAKGLEVWALLDNFTYEVDSREILSYTSKRAKIISYMIDIVTQNGIDGINVDLEYIDPDTGEDYIEFIRELSIACRAGNIVLSVDNYAPEGYNAHYHWKEQGVMADYVIIMGYDEHYAGSQEAGSVASIDFVERGVSKMVEEVPAEKVVNAVPFYTRIWENAPGGLTSRAVGITAAAQFLADQGVTPVWDESTCQNYGEAEVDGVFCQVWLEDAQSLQAKMNIMKKYEIGGVAAWKLGYEKDHPEVWDVLSDFING